MGKRRSISFVEVVVILLVISVFGVLFTPAWPNQKWSAKKTTCLSNLKQLSLAVAMYTNDSDDAFPNTNSSRLWIGSEFKRPLAPYLPAKVDSKDPAEQQKLHFLLHCPSDPGAALFSGTSYAYSSAFFRPASFLAKARILDLVSGEPCLDCKTFTFSAVAHPGKKAMLFEFNNSHQFGNHPTGPWGSASEDNNWQPADDRWEGSRNLALADSHVKYVAARSLTPSHLDTPDPNMTPLGIAGQDIR